jgi:hypothetical protein
LAPLSTSDISPEIGPSPKPFSEHVGVPNALGILGMHKEFDANYAMLMTQFIAAEWPDPKERKKKESALRLLCQPISRSVLDIIWKETVVPDSELCRFGLQRCFSNDPINCYMLAVHLSKRTCDLGANCALFRRILSFAHILNLVAKAKGKGKTVALTGTPTLDALMGELANIHWKSFKAIDRGGCGDA